MCFYYRLRSTSLSFWVRIDGCQYFMAYSPIYIAAHIDLFLLSEKVDSC